MKSRKDSPEATGITIKVYETSAQPLPNNINVIKHPSAKTETRSLNVTNKGLNISKISKLTTILIKDGDDKFSSTKIHPSNSQIQTQKRAQP